MFGLSYRNALDDVFNFHRDFERMFDKFWNELPDRTADARYDGFRVNANDDGWRIDVPVPGVDPQNLTLEVAGNTLTIRAIETKDEKEGNEGFRYERSFTVPQFLDVDKISASHRHGMLQLMLPLKDSVKPRRIQIGNVATEQKQIAA
jgi:HSP20 family protein